MTDADWRWITNSVVVICACVCLCNFFVQAFRFARWLICKLQPEAPKPPSLSLKPGYCECGHERCMHTAGSGACGVGFPPDEHKKEWTSCACAIYIYDPDEDGDDDDTPEPEPDPSVKELERIGRL
jgi:hypothetical protein